MELIAFECHLNENCDYFEFQVEYFIEIVYFEELYTYMYTTAKKNYTRDETDLLSGLQNILKERAMIIRVSFVYFSGPTRLQKVKEFQFLLLLSYSNRNCYWLMFKLKKKKKIFPLKNFHYIKILFNSNDKYFNWQKVYILRVQYYFQLHVASTNHTCIYNFYNIDKFAHFHQKTAR